MKRISLIIFLLAIFCPAGALADVDPCVVDVPAGNGQGSLPYAVANCDSKITFFGVTEIDAPGQLDFIVFNDVELDGTGQGITVKAANMGKPLFRILRDNVTIKGITISYPGTICMHIENDNKTIEDVTFKGCHRGIFVPFGNNNLFSGNNFDDVDSPILLAAKANEGISEPEDIASTFSQDSTWTLSGTDASEGLGMIEIYEQADDQLAYSKTIYNAAGSSIDIFGHDFEISIPWNFIDLFGTYRMLFIDKDDNTSEMSDQFSPWNDENFLPDGMAECGDAAWFKKGGLASDYDDDGLLNKQEDEDSDCAVDDGETDPSVADSDMDGVDDGSDNCPLDDNYGQFDSNDNGIGDACDGSSSEAAGGAASSSASETEAEDADEDGVEGGPDNCPSVSNPDQEDIDLDGTGDACDDDMDDDNTVNVADNCPAASNPDQANTDGDYMGDECDDDDDNDGVDDDMDACPTDAQDLCTADTSTGADESSSGGCTLSDSGSKRNAAVLLLILAMAAVPVISLRTTSRSI